MTRKCSKKHTSGRAVIARATDGVGGGIASSPARDNSLLPEHVTLRSSGESRNPGKCDGQVVLLTEEALLRECHSPYMAAGAPAGDLISRAAMESQLNAVEAHMKAGAEQGDAGAAVAPGMASVGISAARAALRALPAAAQGEPVAWRDLGHGVYTTPAPVFGNIRIEPTSSRFWVSFSVPGSGHMLFDGQTFATADGAKAAAEKLLRAHPSDASLRAEVDRLRNTLAANTRANDAIAAELLASEAEWKARAEAAEARIAELEAERPALIAAAPDWTEAARHMLETFDVWFRGDARDQSDAAHRLILAGSFAAQAFEDLSASGATADGAPVGMMRTFLLALINPALPELDPLRACNRTPADALSQPTEGGEGGAV